MRCDNGRIPHAYSQASCGVPLDRLDQLPGLGEGERRITRRQAASGRGKDSTNESDSYRLSIVLNNEKTLRRRGCEVAGDIADLLEVEVRRTSSERVGIMRAPIAIGTPNDPDRDVNG